LLGQIRQITVDSIRAKEVCSPVESLVENPGKINVWNLKITHFEKENHLNQTIIFRCHVNLPGCSFYFSSFLLEPENG